MDSRLLWLGALRRGVSWPLRAGLGAGNRPFILPFQVVVWGRVRRNSSITPAPDDAGGRERILAPGLGICGSMGLGAKDVDRLVQAFGKDIPFEGFRWARELSPSPPCLSASRNRACPSTFECHRSSSHPLRGNDSPVFGKENAESTLSVVGADGQNTVVVRG